MKIYLTYSIPSNPPESYYCTLFYALKASLNQNIDFFQITPLSYLIANSIVHLFW